MLVGTSGGLWPKLLLKALPMFDYPCREMVFCYIRLHPLLSELTSIVFMKYRVLHFTLTGIVSEAYNPSPVELSISTLKFSIFSHHTIES